MSASSTCNNPPLPSVEALRRAVSEYNDKFGDLDSQLLKLAREARAFPNNLGVSEQFLWEVKKGFKVMGVATKDRRPMARALVGSLALEDGDQAEQDLLGDREKPVSLWLELLARARANGVTNEPRSWASKALHWLYPGLFPVYDKAVRTFVGMGSIEGEKAYRAIIAWEYDAAERLRGHRDLFMGGAPPKTLLRALDKYIWWETTGKATYGG